MIGKKAKKIMVADMEEASGRPAREVCAMRAIMNIADWMFSDNRRDILYYPYILYL